MYLSNSRYDLFTDTSKGALPVVIGDLKDSSGTEYTLYYTSAGDTFDRIAYEVFGDPMVWWEIANINPHVKFPEEIPVGTTLRIPRS